MPSGKTPLVSVLALRRRSLPFLIPILMLLLLPAGARAGDSISELAVIWGSSGVQPPPGFTKINVDLNKGAGGDFIFLCYKRGVGSPVSGIAVTLGDASPPAGRAWTKIDVDLNRTVGGDFIYLWYTKDPDCGTIKDIVVLLNNESTPPGYTKIHVDLNRGAGGDFIYFAYRQD